MLIFHEFIYFKYNQIHSNSFQPLSYHVLSYCFETHGNMLHIVSSHNILQTFCLMEPEYFISPNLQYFRDIILLICFCCEYATVYHLVSIYWAPCRIIYYDHNFQIMFEIFVWPKRYNKNPEKLGFPPEFTDENV